MFRKTRSADDITKYTELQYYVVLLSHQHSNKLFYTFLLSII